MRIRKTACSITLLLFLFCSVKPLFAQRAGGNDSQNSGSAFELSLGSSFGGLFYEDQLGLQIARIGGVTEGFIDTQTYKLGSNDLISIDIKGNQPILMRGILVNSQGDIVIPVVGTVNVKNKTIDEAQLFIEEQIRSTFKNASVIISLEQPRPIVIHINGEVKHPGKYVLPAQSRLDFAIFQSLTEGQRQPAASASYSVNDLLSNNYSFRRIEVTHSSGEKVYSDLISYYRSGAIDENPYVRDGDLITIYKANTNNSRISISGAVKAPIEVEFLVTDTPFSLLSLAGGFSEDADTTRLFLIRKENGGITQLEIVPENWKSFKIKPNDRIIASHNIKQRNAASVWISGEIKLPGNFPIVDGETNVLELLELAGNLTEKALPHAGYLIRAGSVENEVPNKFNTEMMTRTSDQFLQGLEYLELENTISRNRVHINLNDKEQLSTVKLFDGDQIFVPRDENTVFVFGQVNNPGYFPYSPGNMSVDDYIMRAGGVSLSANKERVFVIKAGTKSWFKPGETDLNSGDMIFIDRMPNEDLNALRGYEIQRQQLRNTRIQLVMTGLTTITSIVTAYVAITRN